MNPATRLGESIYEMLQSEISDWVGEQDSLGGVIEEAVKEYVEENVTRDIDEEADFAVEKLVNVEMENVDLEAVAASVFKEDIDEHLNYHELADEVVSHSKFEVPPADAELLKETAEAVTEEIVRRQLTELLAVQEESVRRLVELEHDVRQLCLHCSDMEESRRGLWSKVTDWVSALLGG